MKKKIWICGLLCLLLTVLFGLSVSADAPRAWVQGHGVKSGDTLTMYYVVGSENLPSGATVGVLVFETSQTSYVKGNESVDLDSSVGSKAGFAFYGCGGIEKKQMTDLLYAVPYVKSGDTYLYGKLDSYSILQYCGDMTGKTGMEPRSAAMTETLNALLKEGAAAQTAANYHTERLADGDYVYLGVLGGSFVDGRTAGMFSSGATVTLKAVGNQLRWYNSRGEEVAKYKTSLTVTVGTEAETYTVVCKHNYDQQVTDPNYLKSEATCTAKARYYKSCRCGEKGTETFESGETLPHTFTRKLAVSTAVCFPATCLDAARYCYTCENCTAAGGGDVFTSGTRLGHTYLNGSCTRCGEYKPSSNLTYTSKGDGTCTVSRGTCTDKLVKIPSVSPAGDLVTAVAKDAFKGRTTLTGVVLPSTLQTIGSNAFYNCTALTGVYYRSTAVDWASVTVNSGNTRIGGSAMLYYYSATVPTIAGNFWTDQEGLISIWAQDDGYGELHRLT